MPIPPAAMVAAPPSRSLTAAPGQVRGATRERHSCGAYLSHALLFAPHSNSSYLAILAMEAAQKRSPLIEISHVLSEDPPQVSFAQDEDTVQAFVAYTAKQSLADRVRSRRFDWRLEDFDPTSYCDSFEV